VDSHLHHPHGTHCDDHGQLEVVAGTPSHSGRKTGSAGRTPL
jgi:hypothetical protein